MVIYCFKKVQIKFSSYKTSLIKFYTKFELIDI